MYEFIGYFPNSQMIYCILQVKMDFCIPRYILHDFRDQEESKVIQMILNYAHIPYEFKEVDQNDYILEGIFFQLNYNLSRSLYG